jgi:small subunit ribosomal protein S20
MAITTSAKKALRASLKKRVFNLRRKRVMNSTMKDAKKAMTAESLSKAFQAIDKAAKRGVIKPNTAARKKSRLAKALIAK